MSKIWLTADNHYGHANVIKYANRPFSSVDEMDETMIVQWNAVVQPGDNVYVIGDFSFHRYEKTKSIFNRLKGNKFLILGNHDRDDKIHKLFIWAKDLYNLKVADPEARGGTQNIVLCHYAMRVWNKSHFGSYMLHGHSHGKLYDDPRLLSIDVGVDAHSFTPVSYDQVKALMAKKTFVPIDRRGKNDDDY